MTRAGPVVGVDVGGTFTDLVLFDARATLRNRQSSLAARP
jgi:N-methylhydantoinase A/oxoprolinase/acetone carboxylase beta subunit